MRSTASNVSAVRVNRNGAGMLGRLSICPQTALRTYVNLEQLVSLYIVEHMSSNRASKCCVLRKYRQNNQLDRTTEIQTSTSCENKSKANGERS